MRIVRTTIVDAYKVHKTFSEFLSDCGITEKGEVVDYGQWIHKLSDPRYAYLLLMHGKKIIGMTWGREIEGEPKKTFLVEGRFLRRAYRGKFKFSREMLAAVKELVKDFEKVRMILPNKADTLKKRFKVLGTIVEAKT